MREQYSTEYGFHVNINVLWFVVERNVEHFNIVSIKKRALIITEWHKTITKMQFTSLHFYLFYFILFIYYFIFIYLFIYLFIITIIFFFWGGGGGLFWIECNPLI